MEMVSLAKIYSPNIYEKINKSKMNSLPYINEENEKTHFHPSKISLKSIFCPKFLEKIQRNHSFAPSSQSWRLPRVLSPSIFLVIQEYGCIFPCFQSISCDTLFDPLISRIGGKIKGCFVLYKCYNNSWFTHIALSLHGEVLVDGIPHFILSFLNILIFT